MSSADASPAPTDQLRLLSWNVRSLRDGRDRVAAFVAAARVDVALIQEAPRFARWRSKRAALAREAGLLVGTADRVGGLCLLTSLRTWVVDHRHVALPPTPRLHRRAVVVATVSVAGGPHWRVAVTHLGLDSEERARHAELVRRELPDDLPLVLGADVNEGPDGPAWRALSDGLTDAAASAGDTFPAGHADRRIDGVFVSPGVEVIEARVLEAGVPPASDHLPLLLTLRAG